jgi:hypothetical protein
LLYKEEVELFDHAESSVIRRKGPAYLQIDQTTIYAAADGKEGGLAFEAETGV